MAAATVSSPKTSPQRPNGLLLVTMRLARLVAGGDELEEQVGGLGLERDVADLVDDQERVAGQAGELGLQRAGAVGGGEPVDPCGGGGEQDAVPGLAGSDARGRWRGGSCRCRAGRGTRRCLCGDEVEGAEVGDGVALDGRWWSKSKSSRVLRAGNPAARMRLSPPWASRAATSRCRQAARYSSWVQVSARARSASRSADSRSAGAFRARAR